MPIWYGSQLSVEETRRVAPYQNATGSTGDLGRSRRHGFGRWKNPKAGIVEADEVDFRRCLEVQSPYLGPIIGQYTDWTPLVDRSIYFRKISISKIHGSSRM